ncbi:MAG: ATP-binding protein [Actinomycetota bacterium]
MGPRSTEAGQMTPPLVELEIPSRSAYVAVVRLALASLARSAGLDEEVVDDLKIAVSEACANAVLSHEEAGVDAPVSVSWIEEEDRLAVEIADRGAPYDPDSPEPADGSGFSSRFTMSIALLKSLVEDCEFGPREGGGMCTRLVFSR